MTRPPRGAAGSRRGLELAYRHCRSLDLDAPRARERLERKLGAGKTRFLLEALAAHPVERYGASRRFAA